MMLYYVPTQSWLLQRKMSWRLAIGGSWMECRKPSRQWAQTQHCRYKWKIFFIQGWLLFFVRGRIWRQVEADAESWCQRILALWPSAMACEHWHRCVSINEHRPRQRARTNHCRQQGSTADNSLHCGGNEGCDRDHHRVDSIFNSEVWRRFGRSCPAVGKHNQLH